MLNSEHSDENGPRRKICKSIIEGDTGQCISTPTCESQGQWKFSQDTFIYREISSFIGSFILYRNNMQVYYYH